MGGGAQLNHPHYEAHPQGSPGGVGTDSWSYDWRRLCRSLELKEVVTALHSASLCAQGDAKGGSILRQVGGTGGEGGLQEVEIWQGSLSLEGSSQGTTSATKEGKEESWEC